MAGNQGIREQARSYRRSDIHDLAVRLGQALGARKLMLATAESCTGGWASMAVTAVPGSSDWFERGFVTYSDAAKQEMLGVKPGTLAAHGAVSEAVVREMAQGAVDRSGAEAPSTGAAPRRASPSAALPVPVAAPRPSPWAWCASRYRAVPVARPARSQATMSTASCFRSTARDIAR